MCNRKNNKYLYIILPIVVLLLGFLALAPLREKKPRKLDAAGTKVVPDPDPLPANKKTMNYNVIAGPVCNGDDIACGKTTEYCADGTTIEYQNGQLVDRLYVKQWNGYKDFCGVEVEGLKKTCKDAKDAYVGDWGAETNTLRKACDQAKARFISTILWALGMAACGAAACVAIITCLILRCDCFKGCANKLFRIIIGVLMFIAGTFLAAAVGLFDKKGFDETVKCEVPVEAPVTELTRDLICYKQAPGFFAYICLVVVLGYVACLSAFGAACCCDPDKEESPPPHAEAPSGELEHNFALAV